MRDQFVMESFRLSPVVSLPPRLLFFSYIYFFQSSFKGEKKRKISSRPQTIIKVRIMGKIVRLFIYGVNGAVFPFVEFSRVLRPLIILEYEYELNLLFSLLFMQLAILWTCIRLASNEINKLFITEIM